MKPFEISYKFVYKKEYHGFTDMFKKIGCSIPIEGTYSLDGKSESNAVVTEIKTPKSSRATATTKRWESVRWFSIRFTRSDYRKGSFRYLDRTTTASVILTRDKDLKRQFHVVMRNGQNINTYNIVIFDCQTEKLHFRRNIERAHVLVDLLTMEDKQLPLLINQDMNPKDEKLFYERLKGE